MLRLLCERKAWSCVCFVFFVVLRFCPDNASGCLEQLLSFSARGLLVLFSCEERFWFRKKMRAFFACCLAFVNLLFFFWFCSPLFGSFFDVVSGIPTSEQIICCFSRGFSSLFFVAWRVLVTAMLEQSKCFVVLSSCLVGFIVRVARGEEFCFASVGHDKVLCFCLCSSLVGLFCAFSLLLLVLSAARDKAFCFALLVTTKHFASAFCLLFACFDRDEAFRFRFFFSLLLLVLHVAPDESFWFVVLCSCWS